MSDNKNLQNTQVIAKIFGVSTRRVEQLKTEGVIKGEGRPIKYDFIPTVMAYIKYLSDKAYGREKKENLDEKLEKKLDAEIKYKQAKADKSKLELDELKGTMHRAEDIEKLTNELVFAVRAMLLALPGRVAMDLAALNTAPEVSAYLAKHVAYLLDELATHEYDPEKYAALVREREGWLRENDSKEDDEDEDEQE